MPHPIPPFDHNFVLPPHLGSPTALHHLSPYPCSTLDLCTRFGTSPQRINILHGFLAFRVELQRLGLHCGYQWLDGSFLEDIERKEARDPKDLDLVTIYWGYDDHFQENLMRDFPAFGDPGISKANFLLDHYTVDAGFKPPVTVEMTRYWIQLFTHNRQRVWKGMLQISLNTPDVDATAIDFLQKIKLP